MNVIAGACPAFPTHVSLSMMALDDAHRVFPLYFRSKEELHCATSKKNDTSRVSGAGAYYSAVQTCALFQAIFSTAPTPLSVWLSFSSPRTQGSTLHSHLCGRRPFCYTVVRRTTELPEQEADITRPVRPVVVAFSFLWSSCVLSVLKVSYFFPTGPLPCRSSFIR